MSRIRSKDTKPELLVRKFLFSKGFRYRLHSNRIPGSPDIVLSKLKIVVFVHGCFWHGHPGCRHSVMPKSNQDYWTPKIERNKSRDLNSSTVIRELGWDILTIWECELKPKVVEDTLLRMLVRLNQRRNAAEL